MNEIPNEITNFMGQIRQIRFPQQGDTSDVGIIASEQGLFVLKRTRGRQFRSWLHHEVLVLDALANTDLPVPRGHLYVEHDLQNQSWAVFYYLEGDTLRQVLSQERDCERRQETIMNFGGILAKIHATPCPNVLRSETEWLDRTLLQAKFNLEHYLVDGDNELLCRLMTNKPNPIAETLIHGDFTIDNVLVKDGEIVGVIDWGGGAFGDPRYDVSLAIRPKPRLFKDQADVDIFFKGYGVKNITDEDFTYFAEGLYKFF